MTTEHEIILSWSLHKWMHYPKMFLFLCYKRFTKTGIPETKPVTDQLQNWLSMACRRCGSELQRLVPRPHLTWLQVAWLRGTALEHHSPLWSFIATLSHEMLSIFAALPFNSASLEWQSKRLMQSTYNAAQVALQPSSAEARHHHQAGWVLIWTTSMRSRWRFFVKQRATYKPRLSVK